MKKSQMLLLSTILAFGLVTTSLAQTKVFSEAKGISTIEDGRSFQKWNFSIDGNQFEIRNNGKAQRISKNKHLTNFRLKVEKDETLVRAVYFSEYKNDLLLISEIEVGDGIGAFIVRLNGRTLKTKWQQNIPAFNVTKGVIENSAVYLGAIGFAAKINLETGKYIWKHQDFYRKYDESGAFNVFLTPQIIDDLIVFKEDDILNRGFNHQIQINKSSGKIIKVILN